jgi:hypothetical protein
MVYISTSNDIPGDIRVQPYMFESPNALKGSEENNLKVYCVSFSMKFLGQAGSSVLHCDWSGVVRDMLCIKMFCCYI